MLLAGPLHPTERHLIGQAFLVARMQDRIRQRTVLLRRQQAARLISAPHTGHVCTQPGERRDLLNEIIRQSLRRKRLTVVVHAQKSNPGMLRYLHGERLPEAGVTKSNALLLVPARTIWQSRRPDPAETMEFVDELQALGSRLDHRHVQLISDANHVFARQQGEAPLFALEEWWTRAKLPHVSLACLYRSADLAGFDIDAIARFHNSDT